MPVVMWRKNENREVLRVLLVAPLLVLTIPSHLYGGGFSGRPEEHFTGDFHLQILFPRPLTAEKAPNEKNRKDCSSHCWDFVGILDFCFGFFGLLLDSNLNPSVFFLGIHGEGPIAPSCCVGDGRETSPQNAISVEEFARRFGHFCGNVRVDPLCDESVKVEWVGPVDSHGFFKREIFW